MTDVPPVDLRSYIDLALFDRTPAELAERAVADLQARLPGWVPREGLTEMVLLEAMALEVAELVFAVNRLPGAVAEGILRLQGLPRDQGAAPTTSVVVTFVDDVGRTLPAGTRFRLQVSELEAITVTLDEDAVAAPGDEEAAPAAASATVRTSLWNGTPAGSTLQLLESSFYVAGAVLDVDLAGGRDPETTATWLDRAAQRLARLVDTLLLPAHFVAAGLEEPGVSRAYVADLYDPDGPDEPGDNPGHVTLYVMGPAGAALSAGARDALHDRLRPMTADHLELHVEDAVLTPVDVTTSVVRLPGYTASEVEGAVTAALEAYLSPDAWPFAPTVYRNELIALIDGVAGVDRVATLTVPAADVDLDGYGPLATAGTITVTSS